MTFASHQDASTNSQIETNTRELPMTTRRKTATKQVAAKAKKLALNKETLKDLTANEKANGARGGARVPQNCTYAYSGCDGGE